MRRLVDRQTGQPVRMRQRIKSFRDEWGTVRGWTEPDHPGGTGRVWVQMEGDAGVREFFPSVFGLKWEAVPEKS